MNSLYIGHGEGPFKVSRITNLLLQKTKQDRPIANKIHAADNRKTQFTCRYHAWDTWIEVKNCYPYWVLVA